MILYQEEMCIPCFMASVTLECYDKVWREWERDGGVDRGDLLKVSSSLTWVASIIFLKNEWTAL